MRDGVKLFTAVYAPKDTSRTYPFLITRSPYSASPYGEDKYPARLGPSVAMARAGYIFVEQDVRGRYMSEGTFSEMRPQLEAHTSSKDIDESTDTYDTIDWLLKNIPGNNGRAGLTGTSYPGFYAAAGLLCGHPALKAVSPQAPMVDLFLGDDNAHNGAFYLAANFGFYRFFGEHKEPQLPRPESEFEFGTEDGYAFYLALGPLSNGDEMYYKYRNRYFTDLLKHTSYDSFWQARSLTAHIHDVQPAVLAVGGWYDAEDLQGPLKLFLNAFTRNPKAPVSIVMGPWVHGGWHGREGNHLGPVEFGQNTSTFFQESIETPFFEKWLRDGQDPKLPVAWMFETGRNQWLTFSAWPPPAAQKRTLYFLPSAGLGFDPPQQNDGFDQYVSDPAKPVPATSFIAQGMAQEYMIDDQRYAERRPDVVAYQTPPLDRDVTLAGPIGVRLDASTSGTDSDFVVKLIDVYPANAPAPSPNPARLHMGGYEQLVRGEPFRGRFWKGFTTPEPMPSGQFVEIRYDMPDILHTFKQGHRIMVQVQSSWFPVVDRNPQKFVDSIPFAKPADFQSATQRIGHSAAEPSRLEVLVLE
ncbi:MAG: CocE/NonD family hydrolase [Bryobacteraceae bacterium]|nr:CocE/NonD family hydrolase [Bryobacteraceae bacterium]